MCVITTEAFGTAEVILQQRKAITRARSPLREQIARDIRLNEDRLSDLMEVLNATQTTESASLDDLPVGGFGWHV